MATQTVPCVYENFPQHVKDELARNPSGIVRGCWECHQLFVSTPYKPHFCSKECEEMFNKRQFCSFGMNDKRRRENKKKKELLTVAFESDDEKKVFYANRANYAQPYHPPVVFVNNDLRTKRDEYVIRMITNTSVRDDEFLITIGPTEYNVRVVGSREEKIGWDTIYKYEQYGYLRLYNDTGIFVDVICCSTEEFNSALKRCLFCGKIHSSFWRPLFRGNNSTYSFCCDHCLNIFRKMAREDQRKALKWLQEREHFDHI